MTDRSDELDGVIKSTLEERELEYEHPERGKFFVTIPGTRRLRTSCWLVVGSRSFVVEAFVCRRPDESHENVYRFLLHRNTKLYGVHYAIDQVGDIYLVGRLSLDAISTDELDRLLGQVLEAADGDFNTLLALGFAESIRREWAWRVSRGESTANLTSFRHLVEPNS